MVLGTSLPQFNPKKVPLLVANLSRGRHSSTSFAEESRVREAVVLAVQGGASQKVFLKGGGLVRGGGHRSRGSGPPGTLQPEEKNLLKPETPGRDSCPPINNDPPANVSQNTFSGL
jgi:hypothetical protein